jgi:hypothetical protein
MVPVLGSMTGVLVMPISGWIVNVAVGDGGHASGGI